MKKHLHVPRGQTGSTFTYSPVYTAVSGYQMGLPASLGATLPTLEMQSHGLQANTTLGYSRHPCPSVCYSVFFHELETQKTVRYTVPKFIEQHPWKVSQANKFLKERNNKSSDGGNLANHILVHKTTYENITAFLRTSDN